MSCISTCAVSIVAPEASRPTPINPRLLICGFATSISMGVHTADSAGKSKPCGITPTTRRITPLISTKRPMMFGSLPKLCLQIALPTTTTGSAPTRSSPTANPLPSTGCTPTTSKKVWVTRVALRRCGEPSAIMLIVPSPHTVNPERLLKRSR